MEVLVGPTFTIDVPSSPPSPDPHGSGFRVTGKTEFFTDDLSESSSSIGTPDDSDNEEEDEEVQSEFKGRTGLGSLDSLEDSLPIKRGLSGHFDGKSKSFTDLSQVSTLQDLKKQESPFNKRRRVLIASKWSRKSSFYSWSNPQSMPLLPVTEDHDDDDDDDYEYEQEEEGEKARKVPSASSSSSSSSLADEKKQEDQVMMSHNRISQSHASAHMRLRLGSFKTRSFSLADLQEHDDEEEEDD